MHLFYTPDLSSSSYTLNEEESKHAVKVLRLSAGDELILVDGRGSWNTAKITDAHPKRCEVEITSTQTDYGKRKTHLHIAVAATKNTDRLEWFLEKATEMGIDEITPLQCDHSERPVLKNERLNKVLVSAMKQSLKAYLPQLNEIQSFDNFIQLQNEIDSQKFIAHCSESSAKKLLKDLYTPHKNVIILIGPEGDFSPREVQLASEKGYKEISLGNSRLRTETAALAACMAINLINGD